MANCDFGKPHLENFVKLPAEFNGSEDARLEDARERARYEEARIEAEREQARLQERRMEEYRHLKEQELAAEGRRFVEREQIQILRAHNTPNDVWGGDYRTPVCGVTPGFSIDALITQAYSVPRVERSAR
ncbi:hypothetical protein G7066_13560 [Leucobacter coleopterorum]|uniref:Uncharacterized protein n=1 Tax=Leucobacter coleopterorum TaxID=2714933 RepID=A0ABX6K0F1_9MICO|nr:hypothetical protein [Leucobacter coleopterorum]QIM19343.1 hypothetical protein G7066_13560 [Leucobacter coleopterorum]